MSRRKKPEKDQVTGAVGSISNHCHILGTSYSITRARNRPVTAVTKGVTGQLLKHLSPAVEWLKLEQLDELILAFIDRLPVGDAALGAAEWHSRVQAETEAVLGMNLPPAGMAERLRRVRERAAHDLQILETAWFGK